MFVYISHRTFVAQTRIIMKQLCERNEKKKKKICHQPKIVHDSSYLNIEKFK